MADARGAPLKVGENAWQLPGTLPLTELSRLLQTPAPATNEYHTVAGLALNHLRRIPVAGDRFSWKGWSFEIQGLEGHRIERLLVSREAGR